MYKIDDLVIYSGHGICKVDDISEKTYAGVTRAYYVLSPIENDNQLTISTPVDNSKKMIQNLMDKDEAANILESFDSEGTDWIERPQLRSKVYHDILRSGIRSDIANVANTLLRKKHEIEMEGKKLSVQDGDILESIQDILFRELSIVLKTPYEKIIGKVEQSLKKIS
ncbi:CarD family transcriptional regulator [Virgibacillus soli]|uniref:CarD family transcriptional regulator n=1 Tax=Paracerasibacillus soli TaxID=480284 RepID=A0ABU5CTP5_9BACI|nr:CarD family transcriptional regulator [Virgibacillus soli]MDY0409743.1 CarD family transcriptional regulator [Virgibacillus soli]